LLKLKLLYVEFVGSGGAFKSHGAVRRAKAMVQAVTHFNDANVRNRTPLG
jgi:pyridoxal biosynthesis lyase PdxS